MMAASVIAQALQGRRNGRGWMVRCPAHDDSTPSCSIADGNDGRLLAHCFAGCDPHDVLAALRSRRLISDKAADELNYDIPRAVDKAIPFDWSPRAQHIWKTTIPIIGTIAETYLFNRGCFIPRCSCLRFLPARSGRYPAMVACITDIQTARAISLHFTYLRPDGGGKAPIDRPKILSKAHRKAAGVIRLADDPDVTKGLGIAEGIETALACSAVGWRPVWSAVDAGNVASFPIMPGIECLTIFADHDNAGLEAARRCQQRWQSAGKEACIVIPSSIGFDWADEIRRNPL